jgi:hypothetical protein
MRWFIFVFILLPNFAIADKAMRDKILAIANHITPCAAVFELGLEDEFKKTQLLMQYEIDEELFSMERIEGYAKALKLKIAAYAQDFDVSALTETEKEYLEMKDKALFSASKDHAQNILSDPVKLSQEIIHCVEKFQLDD